MLQDTDDGGWDDWQDDPNAGMTFQSLFTDEVFPSVEEVMESMKHKNGFDLSAVVKQLALDQYGTIRLINFMRAQVKSNPSLKDCSSFPIPASSDFSSEEYFMPVLQDDALLMHDWEEQESHAAAAPSELDEVNHLKSELAMVKEAFLAYKSSTESVLLGGMTANELRADGEAVINARRAAARSRNADHDNSDDEEELNANLDGYFSSYTHYGIHEEMLKDTVRTESYRDAMYKNKELFKGKVVLDVGCGTGILSMMAARAGAAKVIGIDNSGIITQAREIVKRNGLDNVVELIRGKVEDLDDLPGVDNVDIIISEWMGYFLFFESMLDTVLVARDKWLAPNGVVLPDRCTMYVSAVSDPARYVNRITYWDDVYGFNMEPMKEKVLEEFYKPDVKIVDSSTIVSDIGILQETDCCTTTAKEIEFDKEFSVKITKDCEVTGLCVHFDVFFAKKCSEEVILSTSPFTTPTHWKQTLFYLDHPVKMKAGEEFIGHMTASRNTNYHREWDVKIKYTVGGENVEQITKV